MKYVKNVVDKGIVISPSNENEEFYKWDGGGIREAVVKFANGKYYMSYDGAMAGAKSDSYWNACNAVSEDLVHWVKKGPSILSSALTHPESDYIHYPDFCSASSPWDFFDNNKWYRFYLAADHCSPEGIPSFAYRTMLATADSPDGPWRKVCDEEGKSDYVCFNIGESGLWDDETASPGEVMKIEGEKLPYIMFYSGSCKGETERSIGIARTDDLTKCDKMTKEDGNFWIKDKEPILPPSEDIENSSVFFEEETGTYWLFTNHIYDNCYTDAVWVYWSKSLTEWNPENKAIVIDNTVSTFAKKAIGMPSVIRKSKDKLVIFYDGTSDGSISHLNRHIGYAEISLPICVE